MTDPTPETPREGDPDAPPPRRFPFLRKRSSPDAPAPDPGEDGDRTRPGVLRRRRRALLGTYEQGIFDVGGLAMELHGRGLLSEDVLSRRAAEVSDVRAQLDDLGARLDAIREARRKRRHDGRGATVACPGCTTRSRATANFCAACGMPLHLAGPEAAETGGGVSEQVTSVIIAEQVTSVIIEEQVTSVIIPAPGDSPASTVTPPPGGDAR